MVDFVDNQKDRLARTAQHGGDISVLVGQAGAAVGEKADHVRGFDGDPRLLTHLSKEYVVRMHINAAGVDQRQLSALPLHIGVDPIPRHAGGVFHNGDSAAGHFVEKR